MTDGNAGPLPSGFPLRQTMNYYYSTDGSAVEGPCSLPALEKMAADGAVPQSTQICAEGQDTWEPLESVLSKNASAAIPTLNFELQKPGAAGALADAGAYPGPGLGPGLSTTTIIHTTSASGMQQGAVIGGWLCFLLGVGVMYFSLWAFVIYGPLFLVAFILSIAAMAQRRILGGLALLLITLIVPPVQWFYTAAVRSNQFLQAHLPADRLLDYNLQKQASRQTAAQIIGAGEPSPSVADRQISAATPTALSDTPTEAAHAATDGEHPAPEAAVDAQNPATPLADSPHVVELTSDTAPIVFEFKANIPTPTETIARYVLGYAYRDMDEFSKHDFVAKLAASIKQRRQDAEPGALYRVSQTINLREYDFDKHAFPTTESDEDTAQNKYRGVTIHPNADGDTQANSTYTVCFANNAQTNFLPVDLDEAKTLAAALRQSRQALVSYTGTLKNCVQNAPAGEPGGVPPVTNKLLLLDLREISITLKQGGQRVSYQLPEPAEGQAAVAAEHPPAPATNTGEKERLTDAQIQPWDLERVQYAIDAIYGRYGAEFPKRETQAWAERQPWYQRVPGRTPDMAEQLFTADEKFNVDLLAARRNVLRTGVANGGGASAPAAPATPMESTAPTSAVEPPAAPVKPALDAIALLSPERTVTDVWNTDQQITVANFRSQYAGKVVRYSGLVVRKNPKERLLVFKGGGFLTSAYDVQVSLNDEKTPGYNDVAVGDRLTVVATLDRIVPPAFGVGSSSIRLTDGWIIKKSR